MTCDPETCAALPFCGCRHDPLFMSSRAGCWATCTCGWKSATYTTVSGAVIAHGEHLTHLPPEPDETEVGE